MSDVQIPGGPYINSIIGEGTRFNGEFDLNGLLRIDGDFCGTVRTEGKVLVGKNGRAECTVYAGTVVVGGILRGNIFANEKVVILSTGIVLGNIHSPRFIVEEGVIFNGTAKIVQMEAKADLGKTFAEEAEPKSYAPSEESSPEQPPVAVSGTTEGRSATG
jgi:cytoskeletal protein CcmA (bactofilin family)